MAGGKCLPATLSATGAQHTVGVERDVTELAGHAVITADDLAIGEHTRSNAFRNSHQHRVANAIEPAEEKLRQQAGSGGVFHAYVEAGLLLDRFLEVKSSSAGLAQRSVAA